MRKMFKKHLKNISMLVSYAIASSKIKKIIIHEEKRDFSLRSQLHILLRAPTGALKSTILNEISSLTGYAVVDEITKPGLVGTIDSKTFQFIPGYAWTCRNGLLLLDEFRFRRRSEDWTVFLKLLEDQKYTKKIGLFSASQSEEDGDLYVKHDKGKIEMKTRFACIIATMKRFEWHRGEEFKAFVNRCIPYEYDFDLNEIKYILKGKRFIEIKDFSPQEEIEIRKREYNKILNWVSKAMPKNYVGKQNFARCVGDLIRIHAIQNNFAKRIAKDIINWKLLSYNKIGSYYKKK